MPGPTAQPLFTLVPNRWYAMQFVGGRITPATRAAYWPILVHAVLPRKSGKDLVALDFHHANYPMGVQSKRYELRIRTRAEDFLFAERVESDTRLYLLVSELSWEWLDACFGIRPQDPREDV